MSSVKKEGICASADGSFPLLVRNSYCPIVSLAEFTDRAKKGAPSRDISLYEFNFTNTLKPTVIDRLTIYHSELLCKTGAFKPPSEGQPSPYPDLFQVLNTTRTPLGAATILRSIMQPLTSVQLIKAKQESLRELEARPNLEKALIAYIEALSRDNLILQLFFSTRDPGSRVNIMRTMRKLRSFFNRMVGSLNELPKPESPYLSVLIQQINAIPETISGKLILDRMYVPWSGKSLTKNEAKWYQRIFRYIPYPITGKLALPGAILALPALLSQSTSLKTLFGILSVPILLSSIAVAFDRRESDYPNALEPLRHRSVEDSEFLLAMDAIGKIEELLAFEEFKRKVPYHTTLPEFVNDDHYSFSASGLINPVMAAADKNLVLNDLTLSAHKPTVLTGFNSSIKTSTGQGLAANQVMAQMGCYVVASEARVSCASKIYYQGHRAAHGEEGEFGTDLALTRDIVFASTPRDLVILDEPGRGTSPAEHTQLGIRVLKALAKKGVTAFITTHNFDLVQQLDEEGVINPLMIETRDNKATFRIVPGIASSSGAEQIATRLGFSDEDVCRHFDVNSTPEPNSS
jgi:DNA mismatch repair protein MutS